MPPLDWETKTVQEPPVEDDSFPSALLERRNTAQETPTLPIQHPMFNRRAVVVGHGEMPLSEDMGGRLSRPARLPEEPSTFLGGVV
jgi:hypothetical protein